MMRRETTTIFFLLGVFITFFSACGGGASGDPDKNEIMLYVSLGPSSHYPENATDNQDRIFNYWGRTVRFSVQGLDEDLNSSINLIATSNFDWEGSSYQDGTLYANTVFKLQTNGKYPGGSYKFKFYVDWNDNAVFDAGDVFMGSYSLYADQDEDPKTPITKVAAADWGTQIRYDDYDNSIVVNDPLDSTTGTPWIVHSIGEGVLQVY
ncbi:MAG: hypothetical protein OEZ43_16505 [Gammaproteobacteria bacterium]|nr:hypothetical protein [Gammaproteobacteria bacterium]